MKGIIRTAVNTFGFDVVRLRNSNNELSDHLANVFAAKGIDCVIDVGANSGQYGLFLRALGFAGYIVSFEPVKAVYERLCLTAANDKRWICYNIALGDKAEIKTINAYKGTQFSSFLEVSEYSKRVWDSLADVRQEDVSVAILDDMFAEIVEFTGCESFYLKMDTQGYDRNVFLGALGSLGCINAMQSELSLIAVYNGMPPAYDVLNEFHKRDFFISGMYPINRDASSLVVIEYDCVLVKRQVAQL
jgi:FkbM family methyltransferase